MPATTNFQIFNEANNASTTYNDSEYTNATQRLTGVTPGMALSRMHNKMYLQWSAMCKAIADFIVNKGHNAMDNDTAGITAALEAIIAEASSDLGYLLRQNSTEYKVGDIAFSASLPSSLVLKCTTAGTTAATEPDFSGAKAGGTVIDGSVTWTYMNLLSIGHSIGEIFPYAGTSQPPGALLCNGAAVSRTMYAKLFAEVGTKYGAGDGVTTFNLPNVVNRFLEGDVTSGTVKEAGVPNITGFFDLRQIDTDRTIIVGANGAVRIEGNGTYLGQTVAHSTTELTASKTTFDASRSNPIYGNSDTVQPAALTMRYYIQAFDASTDPALVDLTQIVQDLANKLPTVTFNNYTRRTRKPFTLADLSAAVAENNYVKYDILPGDYFEGESGYTYIFAGANPLKGTNPYTIQSNHAGLIVQTHTTSKWNNANDTTGGYVSSVLHSYLVNTVLPKVKTDLGGVGHLYAHRKSYSISINKTGYNRYGTATGCSNNWAWSENQYISALTEMQVYGGTVWSSSGYDTGEADQQLDVFKRFKHTEIFGNEHIWLRDVASAEAAASAHDYGFAGIHSASYAFYVAGLIAFH